MGKVTAHTTYRNKAGEKIIGVTTALGILAKPALVPWANKLGLQGIEVGKYVDEMADIGTLAHYLVECHFKKQTPDVADYSKNQIDKAENALLKFFKFEKENKIEAIGSELELVSEQYQYGGTCDLYCVFNGKKTLIDFKTCKACYSEHHTQVSAYKNLLTENGYEVVETRIIRTGRDETEGFDNIQVTMTDLRFELFKHCLEIYKINRQLN